MDGGARAEACERDARQRRGPSTMSRQTQSSRFSGDLPSTCSTAATSAESSIHATPSERLRQKLVEEDIFAKFRPLLPAPLLPMPHAVAGRGHRHSQRKQHKREVIEEADHLLLSLNSLDSGKVTSRTFCRLAEASAAGTQASSFLPPPATRRLHVLVQRLAALAVQERRAAGSLLSSGAQATSRVIKEDRFLRYSFATSSHKQVALLVDLMDEPAEDAPAAPLLEVLPQKEKMFHMYEDSLGDQRRMLHSRAAGRGSPKSHRSRGHTSRSQEDAHRRGLPCRPREGYLGLGKHPSEAQDLPADLFGAGAESAEG